MNQRAAILSRPEVTLPPKEAAYLRDAYAGAQTILEYGAGGSTVMAAEMAGKTVVSVETDQVWVDAMLDWFAQNPPKSTVDIIWANIGKTRAWGRPADESQWREFAKYPLEVWDLNDLPHPDVVLIDGRFRAGCVLATAFRCKRQVRVLVDDYTNRPSYHRVEKYVGQPKTIGRLAEFTITPTPIPAEHLLEIITIMQEPY